jgi:hypothetical protein
MILTTRALRTLPLAEPKTPATPKVNTLPSAATSSHPTFGAPFPTSANSFVGV